MSDFESFLYMVYTFAPYVSALIAFILLTVGIIYKIRKNAKSKKYFVLSIIFFIAGIVIFLIFPILVLIIGGFGPGLNDMS